MSVVEKAELGLIFLFVIGLAFTMSIIAPETQFSVVILFGSSLFFCQSLFRDLWYLYAKRRRTKNLNQVEAKQCMCVESMLGLFGVVLGLLLFISSFDIPITLAKGSVIAIAAAILIVGFLIKDYVFEWNPWRIYKEKDHMNIIVSWKKHN